MKRIPLTTPNIDRLPFSGGTQVIYWDTDLPGFGLIVGKRSKTFLVQVDVKDPGKPKGFRTIKQTLGRYGDLTPEQARKFVEGRRDEKRKFGAGKQHVSKQGPAANGINVTLRDMLMAYFNGKRTTTAGETHKATTVNGYTTIIQRHFASWLPLTLPEVAKLTPDIVVSRYRHIETENGPMAARNAFVMLQAVINYAATRYPGTANPLRAIAAGTIRKPAAARTDCLKGDDFRKLHDGIQAFNEVTRHAYLLCLFHGMRHMEAAALQWEHVNLEKQELYIPDTKNRRPLHVPLCRQSLGILELCRKQNRDDSSWVFPAVRKDLNKTGHVRLMSADLQLKTGLPITVQGLRRSFITMARQLTLFEDGDRLTNHVNDSISGKRYDQTDIDTLRQPLQLIADEIERLMKEGSALYEGS